MHIKSITATLVTGLIVFAACKKNDVSSSGDGDASTNNCVVTQSTESTENGRLIPDQYIIAYSESTGTGLTSTARASSFTTDLLQRHNIRNTALQASFVGGARGFIARLSGAELLRLRGDAAISAIEQDRIIAYGSCFQVVSRSIVSLGQ